MPDNCGMGIASLSPDAVAVAREIYRRAEALNLSQKALAQKAGVNETYVRDLYKGRSRNPKHDQLAKVAAALGCTVLDLIDPGAAEQIKQDTYAAQTPQEVAWLRVWRNASDVGKARLMAAIENVLLGELLGHSKVNNV